MQIICDQLEAMAARLGPNGRLPRVQDLRLELGVSLKTLDGALRELERRGVIYRMHGVGVFVAPQQKTIGLVYAVRHTYGSPFWDMLVEQMRLRAEAGHERFRIYMTHPMPEGSVPLPQELVEAVTGGQLQGVIFVGDQNQDGVHWLESQKVPMVTFASPHGLYRVGISHEAIVESGAREMARQGCRRIGVWSPFGNSFRSSILDATSNALDLFQTVLKEAHLSFSEERIWRLRDEVYEDKKTGSYQEQGYRAVQEVYGSQSLQEAPDGLVIINDLMTSGALAAFRDFGLRVGEDVKIATHSNKSSNVLMGYESLLSHLEIDPTALVGALFETLEALMKGETPAQSRRYVEPVVVRPEPAKAILHLLQTKTVFTPMATSF